MKRSQNLGISSNTVKKHVSHILNKTGASNRIKLIQIVAKSKK